MSLGERIKAIRMEKGFTQAEFGFLFTPLAYPSNISQWERGECNPNSQRLKIISELAGITVAELLGDETVEEVKPFRSKGYQSVMVSNEEYEIIQLLRKNETPLDYFIKRQEDYIEAMEEAMDDVQGYAKTMEYDLNKIQSKLFMTYQSECLLLDEIRATQGLS